MPEERRFRGRRRGRALPWLTRGAPWWLAVLLGLALLAAGLLLIIRPLSALGVLGFYVGASCVVSGVADLVTAPQPGTDPRRAGRVERIAPWFWIVVGVLVAAWIGRDLELFGPVIAGALIVSGVLAVARFVIRPGWDPLVGALFGVAEVLFGVLALLWPDATLIVVAVLFGGRTVIFGLTLLVRGVVALSGRRDSNRAAAAPEPTRQRSGRVAFGLRLTGALVVLALAITTTWVSAMLRSGIPVVDAFYDTPTTLPTAPGTLIRYQPYDGDMPGGLTGYRIYYTTTDAAGEIVPSSGVLVVPTNATAPAPLITWAHGTVGVARACAPSIGGDAVTVGGIPAAAQLASLGWAMVATDYPGMGAAGSFPYLIGQGEGRAVLDAARAARQVPGVSLARQTVIWGHSQGGHAALWAGQLAASYAPDLTIVGTAALSPASNPRAMAETVLDHPDSPGASLAVAFVVDSYARYYPDLTLDDVVTRAGRTIVREAASRCTGEGGTLVTILAGLSISRDQPLVNRSALDGPFGQRLTENIPNGPWSAPLFIGQGEADEVIPFQLTADYVTGLCRAGTDVEFRGYPGGTHMSVLADGSALGDDLVRWTTDRLAAKSSTPTCS